MSDTQRFYVVVNDKNEVFSNVRDIKKLDELDITSIRDYVFEERKRAKEALDYIRAFKNYDEERIKKHVSRSVKNKMDIVSREKWKIKELKVNYNFKLNN